MRHSHSIRRNKTNRLTERGCATAHVIGKVIPKICAVGYVEDLKEGSQGCPLFDPEILTYARIELKERLAAPVVKRQNGTLSCPKTIPIAFRGASECIEGGEKIVRAAVEDNNMRSPTTAADPKYVESAAIARRVRSGRLPLHHRSDLKSARKID